MTENKGFVRGILSFFHALFVLYEGFIDLLMKVVTKTFESGGTLLVPLPPALLFGLNFAIGLRGIVYDVLGETINISWQTALLVALFAAVSLEAYGFVAGKMFNAELEGALNNQKLLKASLWLIAYAVMALGNIFVENVPANLKILNTIAVLITVAYYIANGRLPYLHYLQSKSVKVQEQELEILDSTQSLKLLEAQVAASVLQAQIAHNNALIEQEKLKGEALTAKLALGVEREQIKNTTVQKVNEAKIQIALKKAGVSESNETISNLSESGESLSYAVESYENALKHFQRMTKTERYCLKAYERNLSVTELAGKANVSVPSSSRFLDKYGKKPEFLATLRELLINELTAI